MQGKSAVKNKINGQQIIHGNRLYNQQFLRGFRISWTLKLIGDIRLAFCEYDCGLESKQQYIRQEDA